jgi:deazaflavin-dependent oxidoreductase (nitroreductase family)
MNPIGRAFIQLHNFLYRSTGGRRFNFGGKLLLLHTLGAKTGKPRCNPLVHVKDGDGYIVAASAAGADQSPGWYYNLRKTPDATIEIEGETIPVHAEILTQGEERDALYQKLVATESSFAGYEKKTSRVIPIVVLRPRPN